MILVPSDALRAYPGEPTGVFCFHCFEEVQRHEMDGGNLLSCGCYGRFFESGNDRYKLVTQENWQAYLDASTDWRLNEEIASTPIINESPLGARCPSCERDRQIAATGIWMSSDGKRLVAKYGVCKACSRRAQPLRKRPGGRFSIVVKPPFCGGVHF
jgi:hypothetical protein